MFEPIIEVIRQQQKAKFEYDLLQILETYGFKGIGRPAIPTKKKRKF